MKWFRKSILCASLGCLGATASAQEANWRATAIPLVNPPVVSLGRPTPLPREGQASAIRAVSAFVPIQQGSLPPPSVVRAAGAFFDDEPKNLLLPKDLPPLIEPKLAAPPARTEQGMRPAQGVQPPPKDKATIIDIGKAGNTPVLPETLNGPMPNLAMTEVMAKAPITVIEERIIIVDENGQPVFDHEAAGSGRFYASAEGLLWWTRGMRLPPLVITDSPNANPATLGLLGNGTAQIIYGDNTTSTGPNAGGRLTLGYSLDPCGWCTLEASGFFLSRKNDNAAFDSNAFPVLGRPFVDVNSNMQNVEFTSAPAQAGLGFVGTGSIRVDTSSTLFGGEANVRSLLWWDCQYKITGLAGFRFLNLTERLGITENTDIIQFGAINPLPDPTPMPGDHVTIFDRFETRNRFYGGQIGASAEWQRDRWTLEAKFKLALGVTQQSVNIDGGTQLISNGQAQNFPGGLYALPSNMGNHSQSRFGVVPEVGVKLGYQLTDHLRVFVGYEFLCWNSVLRPGDQIDQAIDLNQVPLSGRPGFAQPTQVRPIVPFRTSSYWATGVNAGLEFRY